MEAKITFVTSLFLFISIIIASKFIIQNTNAFENSQPTINEFTANLSQLIELRGFKAYDHYVTTKDGYILNLVEVVNPAIFNGTFEIRNNHKDPILFIHGSITNGKFFVINSIGAVPKNFAHLDISSINSGQIYKLLQDDQTADSLPLLASNFGHSVWILNRRGGYQSQGHINAKPFLEKPITNTLTTFLSKSSRKTSEQPRQDSNNHTILNRQRRDNQSSLKLLRDIILKNPKIDLDSIENQFNRKYWNFTLDDEAKFDIPAVIDHVLSETGKQKLSLVGHSAGSNLILMAQIIYPELEHKIIKSVLWAPAMRIYSRRSTFISYLHELPFRLFTGPAPPTTFIPLIQNIFAAECMFSLVRKTICETAFDALFGDGGDQQKLLPGFASSLLDSFSSHSVGSLLQAAISGKQRYYDYKNKRKNMIAYNQTEPPIYDVTKIHSKGISFWAAGKDGVIPPASVEILVNDMRVPIETHYINQSGVFFNHGSFLFHKNVSNLLIIPSLITLESQPLKMSPH